MIARREIAKNSTETLRLTIEQFHGQDILNIRAWYMPNGETEMRPGKGGFGISVRRLPDLISALEELRAEAIKSGLIEGAAP